MDHTHSHNHGHDQSAYYTEQLCTIGICGALGGVAVALYVQGTLANLLAKGFLQVSVLVAGICLLLLVAVRAIALWYMAGEAADGHSHEGNCCGHDHDHNHGAEAHHHHDHGHEHGHEHGPGHEHVHDHSHGGPGHDHDHAWAPIRYVVLLIPVLIYFFVPLEALSASSGFGGEVDTQAKLLASKGLHPEIGFKELDGAAYNKERREFYEGMIVSISGQYYPSPRGANMFSLVRLKITCCAADARPFPAVVLVDDSQIRELPASDHFPDPQALNRKWVRVTCQIQFKPRLDKPDEWVTVLVVQPTKDTPLYKLIEQVEPDENPYL